MVSGVCHESFRTVLPKAAIMGAPNRARLAGAGEGWIALFCAIPVKSREIGGFQK
jgi:hypothetical protein